ncbi:outer membrane beta-barrel protein [Massilia sp. CCM 8695]|uniref:Outer membrane beta-barrel protein n=1 Tax=Massilia frigida TaxID=2609281 RepID=A0ABX0NGU6_9BURK|nr:porin family protein [Massilia frigida]NHZ83998.1 outer membrane beta-barrel protein [Massilia frigida]
MRMMYSSALLALAAGFSLSASAAPDGAGAYAGTSIGQARASNKQIERDNVSFGLRAGYQFNSNVGVEVFTNTLSFIEAPYYFEHRHEAFPEEHYGVAVTGAVPLGGRFSLTGRAGIGRTKMHAASPRYSDYNETDPSIGAGVRFSFTPHLSINAEAMRLTKTKVTVLSTGFRYQF